MRSLKRRRSQQCRDTEVDKSPFETAIEIMELSETLKSSENEAEITSIIKREDKVNGKASKVNDMLYRMCSKEGNSFLDNSHISMKHIQRGRNWDDIHLYEKGAEHLNRILLILLIHDIEAPMQGSLAHYLMVKLS